MAGISSSVYWVGVPATLRQRRGSVVPVAHFWLTGWFSVAFGAGTLVQRVQ